MHVPVCVCIRVLDAAASFLQANRQYVHLHIIVDVSPICNSVPHTYPINRGIFRLNLTTSTTTFSHPRKAFKHLNQVILEQGVMQNKKGGIKRKMTAQVGLEA